MSRYVFRARVITALLLLAAGFIALWGSRDLPFGTLNRIQAGFFPTVFGCLLSGLSLVFLASVLWNRKRGSASADGSQEEDEPVNLRGALLFIGIFVLFVLVTIVFGFLAASVLALAAAGYVLGLKGWRLIVLSVGTTAVVWLLFDLWLGLSLPTGIFS
jgi:hypothetical protein